MSTPKCSVCGADGVRLYRPFGHDGLFLELEQEVRCNACVPAERPALLAWAPHVPEAIYQGGCTMDLATVERALLAWIKLPEAARTPVWWQRTGWIDVENAPGAT